jgi:hypothetical protein
MLRERAGLDVEGSGQLSVWIFEINLMGTGSIGVDRRMKER